MSHAEIVVIAGGLAAVLWINWYFFVAGRAQATAAVGGAGGPQRLRIEVRSSFMLVLQFIKTLFNDPDRLVYLQHADPCTVPAITNRTHFSFSDRDIKIKIRIN